MTDLNKIIAGAKSIERILTDQFGGTGRGMREKLDSARYPIPEPLRQRIAYLARVRNRCVHEEGYELKDTGDYVRKCESVCAELQQAHAIAVRVSQQRTLGRGNGNVQFLKLGGMVLVLALAGAWWAVQSSKPGASMPEAESATVQDAQQEAPPVAEAAPAAVPRRHQEDAATPAAGAGGYDDAASPAVAIGTHQGIGNDVLAVESVQFGYAKGSFNDTEPRISVTVHNTSDRTISSARADGRLYVGGEAAPLVDTTAGDKPLYLFFGDEGLAPGARRKVAVSLFGDDRWKLPDAINAGKRTLVLRIAQVSDGRKEDFGGGPRAWPVVEAGATAAAPKAASPTMDADTYRQRFQAGEHVVLSDSRLDVGKVALSLKAGSFGDKEPNIQLTVTNHAGVTLSAAAFHLQLFIKGENKPVIDSDQNTFSRDMLLFFGDAGLADGGTVKRDLYINSFHDSTWKAPDVLKAIREGRAQLVLRLASLSDGRKNTLQSKAIPMP